MPTSKPDRSPHPVSNHSRIAARLGLTTVLVLMLIIVAGQRDTYRAAIVGLEQEAGLHAYMQTAKMVLEGSSASRDGKANNHSGSLISVATSTAERRELVIDRFLPIDDENLQLWVDEAPVSNLMGWLDDLVVNHDVTINRLLLTRKSEPGVASVQLDLSL
ncbi:type II secretion system protein GspM [Parahaliea aestuarii]|nr:type II secretion system protein GspM [Parahaliea aestuarii]